MSDQQSFAAIVLAAGLSKRMLGPNKLLELWRGRPLASYAIEAACASKADRVILVTGRDADEISALSSDAKILRAHAADYEKGLSASLRAGLQAAGNASAIVVLLADMPDVSFELIDELLDAWRPDAYALAPSFDDQWGNPVLLGADAARDARSLTGDKGARGLLQAHRERVIVHAVDTLSILRDFDLPGDFSR